MFAIGVWLTALAEPATDRIIGGQPTRLERADDALGERVWHVEQGWLRRPAAIPIQDEAPPSECLVEFLTPLVSKHEAGADALMPALRTRAQRLINRFGDRSQLERASIVWHGETIAERTVRIPLGRRTLAGRLLTMRLSHISEPGWRLLRLGEHLLAGGQTALGCGRYRLATTIKEPSIDCSNDEAFESK